ncbi:F0F1 ATP synthase subunit epsilon [Nocardioides yefusunii]|uniref:ATP synthase epsilon chain n=1 Tax=Nocardioides yefusunii TaxID=2500546 RepID=A0ABW1QXI3_9ACTN|nr:F0F1 ATP synthase subunit epsilon [Nocardioides yefusunii]
MAGQLRVELVAADRVVWSGDAKSVTVRTVEGEIGVLPNHAPLLSVMVAGVVTIHALDGQTVAANVDEGFVSVANNRVSVLAEHAGLAS